MCVRFTRALADAVLALLSFATFVEAESARGLVGLEEVANARIATILFWVAAAEIIYFLKKVNWRERRTYCRDAVRRRRNSACLVVGIWGTNGEQVRRPEMITGQGGEGGRSIARDVYSRRTVGTLIEDPRSLVLEQRGVALQLERHGLSGCFGGGGRVELELGLRVGVRLRRRGYGRGRAGDVVQVGGRTDLDQPGQGIGAARECCTFMQALVVLGTALDDRIGRRGVGSGGMDGTDEEREEE